MPAPTAAEAALCAELLPRVRLYFHRHLPGPAGEEAAQEAIAVLLIALRAGAVNGEPGAYLHGVCRNLARNHSRKVARQARRATLDLPPESSLPEEIDLDGESVWRCLNLLGGRAREVVLRTYVEGEDGPTIARAVGVTDTNVRAIRYRAILALRECVNQGKP